MKDVLNVDPSPRAPSRRLGAMAAGLLLLTLLGYANSFPGAFIWDDWVMVWKNPTVDSASLTTILATDYCGKRSNCGTYRPVTTLTYAANRRIFGTEPLSFHAFNVLLHGAVTVALFFAFAAMRIDLRHCWLAAALFGVHPVHTEAVNIVTYRSELLAAFGVLLALGSGLRRGRGHTAVVVAGYAMALLSKESGLTFLLIFPLADAFACGGFRASFRGRRLLYALLAAVTALWFLWRHALDLGELVVYPTDNPLVGLPAVPGLLTALKAQGRYLAMLVFPWRLQAIYTGASVGVVRSIFSSWGAAIVVGSGLAAAFSLFAWRRRSPAGLGLVLYAAAFAVTANVLMSAPYLLGERFAYLPSAGFCLAAGALLARPAASAHRPWAMAAARALPVAYLALLSVLLVVRNGEFANELVLSQAAVDRDPGNARAWHFLGAAHAKGGRIDLAEQAYRRSIAVDPGFPDAYVNLAGLLLETGRIDESVQAARQSLSAAPGLGIPLSYVILARAEGLRGNFHVALAWLDRAAPVFDEDPAFWDLRAAFLGNIGDHGQAEAAALRLGELDPGPEASLRLAEVMLMAGRAGKAEPILRRTEALLSAELGRRKSPELLNRYGITLSYLGRKAEAAAAFRSALEIDPGSVEIRANLDQALREGAESPGGARSREWKRDREPGVRPSPR